MFRQTGSPECVIAIDRVNVREEANADRRDLRVTLPAGVLHAEQLEQIIAGLLGRPWIAPSLILFDFSAVCELAGPWSIPLALLIDLSHRTGFNVRVTGLHGQPLDVAWLYRNSPEVQSLLGASESSTRRHAA